MSNPMMNQMGSQSQMGNPMNQMGQNMNNPMMNQQSNNFMNQGTNQMQMQNPMTQMLQQQQQQQQQAAMMQQQMMQQQMMQQMAQQQQHQMIQQQMMQQQMMNQMAQQQAMQQANLAAQAQNILNNSGNNPNVQSPTAPQMNQPQGGGITIIFRTSGQNAPQQPPISIQCMPDDRVSTAIEKYRNKANDRDMTKKFIFNAKQLNQSLSLSEAGIAHNSNIFVVTTKGVQGA